MRNPLIIGPDSESEQWVSAVANGAGAPRTVLEKARRGDRDIEMSIRNLADLCGQTPVLVDDIVSSGRTMIQAIRLIVGRAASAPICVAVHGLFADRSDVLITQAGACVVATDSVPHATNAIDVGRLLANAFSELAVATS